MNQQPMSARAVKSARACKFSWYDETVLGAKLGCQDRVLGAF